jgi:secretory phospholipase A2
MAGFADKRTLFVRLVLAVSLYSLLSETASAGDANFKRSKKTLNMFQAMPDNTTDCVFQCPEGSVKKPKDGYTPEPAQCTSVGMELKLELFESTYPGIRDCCFDHDKCYGTCTKTKKECDDAFSDCMDLYCNTMDSDTRQKSCNVASNLLDTSTEKLGCDFYLKFQDTSCDCKEEKREEL